MIGGGYAAAEEAVYLTRYGKSVTMIIREPDFTCAKLTAEAAKNHPKIKIVYNIEVKEITGDDFVRKLCLSITRREKKRFMKRQKTVHLVCLFCWK